MPRGGACRVYGAHSTVAVLLFTATVLHLKYYPAPNRYKQRRWPAVANHRRTDVLGKSAHDGMNDTDQRNATEGVQRHAVLCVHAPLYGRFNNQLLAVNWARLLARRLDPLASVLLDGDDYLSQNWVNIFGYVPGVSWRGDASSSTPNQDVCTENYTWEQVFMSMLKERPSLPVEDWPLTLPVARVREEAERLWDQHFDAGLEKNKGIKRVSVHGRSFEGSSWHCHNYDHAGAPCQVSETEGVQTCDYAMQDVLARFSRRRITQNLKDNFFLLFSDGQNPESAATYPHQETGAPLEVQMWMMAISDIHIGHPGSSQDYVVWRWRKEVSAAMEGRRFMLPFECYQTPEEIREMEEAGTSMTIAQAQDPLERMVFGIQDPVFVMYGNKGYRELLGNFVCNTALFPPMHSHTLMIVTEQSTADYIRSLSEHIHIHLVRDHELNEAYDFGTPDYLKLMMHRGTLLVDLLGVAQRQGKSVVWLEPDFHYTQNLLSRPEITETTSDMVFYWDHAMHCGCFMRFAPVPASVRFYKEVMDRMQRVFANHGETNDQIVLNDVIADWLPNFTVLDKCLYRSGAYNAGQAGEEEGKRCSGIRPVAQHHNWIVGLEAKVSMAKRTGGWFLTDDGGEGPTCKSRDMLLVVMTMNRPWSLKRLIDSLDSAEYDDNDNNSFNDRPGATVDLRITVDRGFDGEVNMETMALLKALEWKRGVVDVHVWPKKMGLFGQWVDSWPAELYPEDLYKAVILLEDDLEVSPHYAKWFVGAHKSYGNIPGVGAITGQRPTLVASMKAPSSVDEQVPAHVKAFGYLLMATWSLSPRHAVWREFRRWVKDTREKDPGFIPLVPGILPNLWYEQFMRRGDEENMWEMWFIRFADERQLHTVYPWCEGGSTTLVGNWMESGLHYSGKPVLDYPVTQVWSNDFLAQNPLPLVGYDMQFENGHDGHAQEQEVRWAFATLITLSANKQLDEHAITYTHQALLLAKQLASAYPGIPLLAIVPDGRVHTQDIRLLQSAGYRILSRPGSTPAYAADKLSSIPRVYHDQYMKFWLWNETDFDFIVYLDSDTFFRDPTALRFPSFFPQVSEQHVVACPTPWAHHAPGDQTQPVTWNGGFFILKPSANRFERLMNSPEQPTHFQREYGQDRAWFDASEMGAFMREFPAFTTPVPRQDYCSEIQFCCVESKCETGYHMPKTMGNMIHGLKPDGQLKHDAVAGGTRPPLSSIFDFQRLNVFAGWGYDAECLLTNFYEPLTTLLVQHGLLRPPTDS